MNGRLRTVKLSILLSTVLVLACSPSPTGSGLALVGVTVIDGLGNPPVPGRTILVRDGRIAEIAPADSYEPPRGAKVIDLAGRFVMPGLIDMHAHVTILPVGYLSVGRWRK